MARVPRTRFAPSSDWAAASDSGTARMTGKAWDEAFIIIFKSILRHPSLRCYHMCVGASPLAHLRFWTVPVPCFLAAPTVSPLFAEVEAELILPPRLKTCESLRDAVAGHPTTLPVHPVRALPARQWRLASTSRAGIISRSASHAIQRASSAPLLAAAAGTYGRSAKGELRLGRPAPGARSVGQEASGEQRPRGYSWPAVGPQQRASAFLSLHLLVGSFAHVVNQVVGRSRLVYGVLPAAASLARLAVSLCEAVLQSCTHISFIDFQKKAGILLRG